MTDDAASSGTLRVEVKFKNARLYNAILAAAPLGTNRGRLVGGGGRSVIGFCRAHGLAHGLVYSLLNLRLPGMAAGRVVKRLPVICDKLAALLSMEKAELFPAALYEITWPRLVAELAHERFVPLSAARNLLALPASQEDDTEQRELREAVLAACHTLTPREEKVIRCRFGLDGPEETFQAIADDFKVSKVRIRQVEIKALRKLRHPLRADTLKPFLRVGTR